MWWDSLPADLGHFPGPAHQIADPAYPVCRGGSRGFSNVVYLARRSVMENGLHDSPGNVLNVSMGPAPSRDPGLQQYERSAVGHSLDVGPEPVMRIAGSIDGRKSQNGTGDRTLQNRPLGQNLFVVVHPVGRA